MSQRIPFSEAFNKIRENLYFVLVEPESPGNVGSVARAMKTMGFKQLLLVNPCDVKHEEARMMAHRSYDIIEKARIVPTFDQAIGPMRLVVGTTMRKRHFRFPFFTPQQAAERLMRAALEHPVAIVFGREHSGLTNEELLQCHIHSTIATATQKPALNLAQAVMIYAYTFFTHMNQVAHEYEYNLASQQELETFYQHLIRALDLVHFVPRDGIENFLTRVRRLIGRAMAEQRDVRLLHKLLQIFETRINDLEKQAGSGNKRAIY